MNSAPAASLASIASPFHAGELEAQALAGVSAPGAAIREFMPDQHRTFFAMLPFVLAATTDDTGWPIATLLSGSAGFISSPDPRTLQIAVTPHMADPVLTRLSPHRPVGLLGIDFGTRRRNRANGVIATADSTGLAIAVHQSFGNCPKYIQAREVHAVPDTSAAAVGATVHLDGLDLEARALITRSDTFFVATASGPDTSQTGAAGGVDISHRGGRSGFIRVNGDTLTIPDFTGNRYFNTLGNMLLEPRAALLFVDFSTGDLLHLQGAAEILWNADAMPDFSGAERFWRFRVTQGWRIRNATPLRWIWREYAPTTERTGVWPASDEPES